MGASLRRKLTNWLGGRPRGKGASGFGDPVWAQTRLGGRWAGERVEVGGARQSATVFLQTFDEPTEAEGWRGEARSGEMRDVDGAPTSLVARSGMAAASHRMLAPSSSAALGTILSLSLPLALTADSRPAGYGACLLTG